MSSRVNDLNITIGVPTLAIVMNAENGELKGSLANAMKFWFEKGIGANVTYVATNISGNEMGKCDATGACTGHIGQLWIKGQDVDLLRQPLSISKWVLRPPAIYSPAAITWSTNLISIPPEPSNVQRDGDVIDSFNMPSLIATLIWMTLIYLILIGFRKVHRMFARRSVRNIFWEVLRAACFQCDFRFGKQSFRLLAVCILVGMFVTKAFYDGNFKTDLTIKEELDYIDNVDDLLMSHRWPVFVRGDTAIKYFETSLNENEREVFAIAKSRDTTGQLGFMDLTFDAMVKVLGHVRLSEAVMITQYGCEQIFRALDCHKQVNNEGSHKSQLYSSVTGYNDEINAFIYNPNILPELRLRLDKRILTLFEMHVFFKDGVTDFQGTLAKSLFVDDNWNYWRCINPRHDDNEQKVFPLRIINITKLIQIMVKSVVFSSILLLAEILKRLFKRRTRRKRKIIRQLNARRRSKAERLSRSIKM